jgi:DNA-directed RNA polymerase subunit M/transcription elongation factor TFIIS
MAKKKRGAPSKACPNCQAVQHVATKICKECGYAFAKSPAAKKSAVSKKGAVSKKTRVTRKSVPSEGLFDSAISYIRSAGGSSEARKLIDTIEAIKELS